MISAATQMNVKNCDDEPFRGGRWREDGCSMCWFNEDCFSVTGHTHQFWTVHK